jgi:hypothetical protein
MLEYQTFKNKQIVCIKEWQTGSTSSYYSNNVTFDVVG